MTPKGAKDRLRTRTQTSRKRGHGRKKMGGGKKTKQSQKHWLTVDTPTIDLGAGHRKGLAIYTAPMETILRERVGKRKEVVARSRKEFGQGE